MRPRILPMLALLLPFSLAAHAADTLRVGKDVVQGFPMMPLNVGMQTGIFGKYGIQVQEEDFNGAAKMQTAMVAGDLDIGIGGGPEMAYIVKGAPELAVAATSGAPVELSLAVGYDSPIRTPDDLKGKRVWISSFGGLSNWLVREFARSRGWGPEGVTVVPLVASQQAQVAALKTGQIDAVVTLTANALQLQDKHQARLLIVCSDYVHDFISHGLFATNTLMQKNPDLLRRFLAGWFDSVAWMRAHKDETVKIVVPISGFTAAEEAQDYDMVMPTLSATGMFEPKALDVLGRSFVDVGMLDKVPDMTKLYTEAYLPGVGQTR